MVEQPPLLSVRDLTKQFVGTTVLADVDLDLGAGHVLALLGENGAGKSTLTKIVAGLYPHGDYGGRVLLDGEEQRFGSIRDAEDAGIVMVPQELHVIPHLSIADNMFAGQYPGRFGLYARDVAIEKAREALRVFAVHADPRAPAGTLSPSERRLIALAAALSRDARVLILDEPTAALAEHEASTLLDHVTAIRERGIGIVYITHRLDEIAQVATDVVVMRNGRVSGRFDEVPPRREIIRRMLGDSFEAFELASATSAEPVVPGDVVLAARDITVSGNERERRARVDGVSFEVREGEIVGLYGLVGAGRTELGRALFGAWNGTVTGACTIAGIDGFPRHPGAAIARGMTMLTEDRKSEGIIPGRSVAENLSASVLDELGRAGVLVDRAKEDERTAQLIRQLAVRPPLPDRRIEQLSGGNQQKVLLGRCLTGNLRVLILDEPTLGVDIGARRDIYVLIREIARTLRVGILLISSDVDEIIQEADRTMVMYKGTITGEFGPRPEAHDLLAAATGAGS